MKKGFYRVLGILMGALGLVAPVAAFGQTVASDAPGRATIREALEREMAAYPKSQLADVYKNFFQDNFGPGHILNDTVAAGRYLRRELAETDVFEGPLYEPTGHRGNFLRVNISLIKDGKVDYDTYFSAFVRSVQGIVPPAPGVWRKEWAEIDSEIKSMGLTFPGEEADRKTITERLASDDFAVHHSQLFNDNYNFHYRIISRDIFEKEILPKLKK